MMITMMIDGDGDDDDGNDDDDDGDDDDDDDRAGRGGWTTKGVAVCWRRMAAMGF
jgi:hypothetical protein